MKVSIAKFTCRECCCEVRLTQEKHAKKYTCPKCSVFTYHQANGSWLMLKRTNGGRVFGMVPHSEITIVSTDVSATDFPFSIR